MKRLCSTIAILLMSGGLALAQAGGGAGTSGASGAGAGSGTPGGSTGPSFTPTNPNGSPPANGGTVGQAPGTNANNPHDMTNRNNPQDLTKPGGNNAQELKR
jgi:hypothetical protein